MSRFGLTLELGESVFQQENQNAAKLTESGSFVVGDFKINQAGFSFPDEPRITEPHRALPERTAALPQSSSVDLSSLQVADLDELRVTANLGQGASGVVQRVLHTPSQVELALKVVNVPLDQNEKAIKHLITELKTLHLSVCPQIVSFHGAFFRDAAIYLCLEYMDFGSLADLLKRVDTVPERYLAHISRQVLQGLSYLHQERRIIHRDIKPSNILLNRRGQCKIADFGVSGHMEISVDAKSSFVGTVTYMSPERIQGGAHSFDSDLWSFGLTLAECALGCFPYDDSTAFQPRQSSRSSNQSLYDDTSDVSLPSTPNAERGSRKREHADISTTGTKKRGNSFWVIMDNIVSMAPPKIPEERFSSEFCSFVDACLQKEPSQRPTVATLLQHPFLTKYAAPTGTDPAAFAMSELCDWIRTIEQSRSNANSATNSTASSPMARVASIGSGVAASPRNPIGAVSSSVRSALATPSALADVAILVPTPRNNVVATGSSSTATPLSHSAANLSLASNSPEFETLATRSSTVSAAAPPRATKTFRFEAPSAVSSSALRVKSGTDHINLRHTTGAALLAALSDLDRVASSSSGQPLMHGSFSRSATKAVEESYESLDTNGSTQKDAEAEVPLNKKHKSAGAE